MSDMLFFHDTLEPPPREKDRGLEGYHVQARDGDVGTVADVSTGEGEHHIVVHTGRWITSRDVLLAADVVESIDPEHRRIHVNRTRADIKAAAELEERRLGDRSYLEAIGWHYRAEGAPAKPAAARASER